MNKCYTKEEESLLDFFAAHIPIGDITFTNDEAIKLGIEINEENRLAAAFQLEAKIRYLKAKAMIEERRNHVE